MAMMIGREDAEETGEVDVRKRRSRSKRRRRSCWSRRWCRKRMTTGARRMIRTRMARLRRVMKRD